MPHPDGELSFINYRKKSLAKFMAGDRVHVIFIFDPDIGNQNGFIEHGQEDDNHLVDKRSSLIFRSNISSRILQTCLQRVPPRGCGLVSAAILKIK